MRRRTVILVALALAAGAGAEWESVSAEELAARSAELGVGVLAALPDAGGGVSFVYRHGGLKFGRWAGKGASFEYSTIDADCPRPSNVVLAVGPDGRPHVVYESREDVTYAFWDGTAWSSRAIPFPAFEYVGGIVLSLDNRGEPGVLILGVSEYNYGGKAWLDRRSLVYATRGSKGADWVFETVDSWISEVGFERNAVDLAMGPGGVPHICYTTKAGSDRAVKYAVRTASGWKAEAVAAGFYVEYASVAVGPGGEVHISFFDDDRGDLYYARREGGAWAVEPVDARGWVGVGASLAVDGDGVPCVAYYEDGPLEFTPSLYRLKVARRSGPGWSVATAEEIDRVGYYCPSTRTAVALDSAGRPRVVYAGQSKRGEYFKTARWAGERWPTPTPEYETRYVEDERDAEINKWARDAHLPKPALRTLYVEPDEESAVVAEDVGDEEVELIDAVSLRGTDDDPVYGGEVYETWYKARVGGKVGWGRSYRVRGTYDTIVEFSRPYSPLREKPSPDAPAIKEETYNDDHFNEYALRPAVPAGTIYDLEAAFNGWYCVGHRSSGAWLPADAPGLKAYRQLFLYIPANIYFSFYIPLDGPVEKLIITSIDAPCYTRLAFEDPVVTVATTRDEYDVIPRRVWSRGGFEHIRYYFEAVLPRAIGRDEITAVTFETGVPARRFRVTVDPRPAWAEYDEGR